jgi:hypothetical protein
LDKLRKNLYRLYIVICLQLSTLVVIEQSLHFFGYSYKYTTAGNNTNANKYIDTQSHGTCLAAKVTQTLRLLGSYATIIFNDKKSRVKETIVRIYKYICYIREDTSTT